MELGISTSITFALYAPLEYNQRDQIESIMRFFRKVYIIIGFIIFFTGLAIIPIFPRIINSSLPLPEIITYYIFFLLRTTSNFWFGYRGILFVANQESYKSSLITNLSWAFLYITEILISIFTQDFLLYSFSIFGVNLFRILIMYLFSVKEFGFFSKFKKVLPGVSPEDYTPDIISESGVVLSEEERRAVLYIIREIQAVKEGGAALQKSDLAGFSKVINNSHQGLRDLFEISCPEVDWLVKRGSEMSSVCGVTEISVGITGTLVALIENGKEEEFKEKLEEYERIFGFRPTMREYIPSGSIRIIPEDEYPFI